ncbi:MAG: hypothetical protein MJK14_27025 [Rivularia sp. ALOHA_DT_140]|nr:hypothetical protein [Rivularia sp. ALOHA_DT_140]
MHIFLAVTVFHFYCHPLKPGGLFILIDYHPFFLLQGIPTNFDGENGKSIAIENLLHLFSDHANNGCRVNFKLLEMQERIVDSPWIEQKPGMGKYINQPISFCMVWENLNLVNSINFV